LGLKIGTLMYSDRKPGDSTAFVSGFGSRLLKIGNQQPAVGTPAPNEKSPERKAGLQGVSWSVTQSV
jgi:hypothetical protein